MARQPLARPSAGMEKNPLAHRLVAKVGDDAPNDAGRDRVPSDRGEDQHQSHKPVGNSAV